MEAVQKSLQDPAWWFSTVVIAIAASVFAGFVKDWLEKRYGFFLRWSAEKRRQLRVEREELISKWSSSESLLTIAMLQMIFWTTGFFALALLYALYITYLRLKFNYTAIPSIDGLNNHQIFNVAIGVVAISFYAFKVVRVVFISADMLAAFRKSRGLPKFAE